VDIQLRLGGRTLHVALAPEREGFAVSVDGDPHRVTPLGARVSGVGVEEL